MKSDSPFLFAHGGPGGNSVLESRVLAPLFGARKRQIRFWNEPSRQRPEGGPFRPETAYEDWIASLERKIGELYAELGPITLIAHSYAVGPSLLIIERHPEWVSRLVSITPALDFYAVGLRILGLARGDLAVSAPKASATIAEGIAETKVFFDVPFTRALEAAAGDEQLFSHYWANKTCMQAWFEVVSTPGSVFDLESFFSVCLGTSRHALPRLPKTPLTVPAVVLFGKHDPVVEQAREAALAERVFRNFQIIQFSGSGHYPHIEEAERFVELITASTSGGAS